MNIEVPNERLEITGLPRGTKHALEELGKRNGNLSAEEYARTVLEAKILAQKSFREILAPAREGFAESGLTDDELDALVEKAREDFFRETSEEGE